MPIWRRSGLVAEVLGDGGESVALLNLRANRPIVLKGSAMVIWSLVDGVRTDGDMLAELRDEYGTEAPPDLEAQLAAFLGQLAEQGLVEAVPAETVEPEAAR
jgi:hypothetical protein